jgi:hypothetical protein
METEQKIEKQGTAANPAQVVKKANCFAWWNNPTDKLSFFLVVVTFLLFIATVALVCKTNDLVVDAKKSSELSARAWVVPTGASFFDRPVTEQSRIKIELENMGKIAAVEIGQIDETPETRPYTRIEGSNVPYIDDKKIDWPTKPLCESKERDRVPIGSIYPSQKTYYVRHGARGNIPDLLKGGYIIVVRGCFVYNDVFGARKSPYCFYSVPPNDKQIPVGDWTFAPCLGTQENPT